MAVYEYEILGPDGQARGIYEAEQKMSDPPLARHPETGEPLRRILTRTFARSSGETASTDCAAGSCGLGPYGQGGGCSSGLCGLG